MNAFIAEPAVDGDGWIVSDRSKKPPDLRFIGTREECECVAAALNALARRKHEELSFRADEKKRFDHLMQWDREREDRMRVLDECLRAWRDGRER